MTTYNGKIQRRRRAVMQDEVRHWRRNVWQDTQRWYMTTTRDDHDSRWHTRRRTTMHDDDDAGLQWLHSTTNDSGWLRWWLLSAAESYYCEPRFANLLILSTYDFNLNAMQSTVISLTCQSQSMARTRQAPKGPQINTQLYTTYWSRGMAEYNGKKADVFRIDIRLLPIVTSANTRICFLPSSVARR